MATLQIPETPNVTLVGFYGNKPSNLTSLVLSLQKRILDSEHLTGRFEAYQPEQVHATLLGCEGLKTVQGILSKWFLEKRSKHRYIDLNGFINYVRTSGHLPITVRIGGFDNKDYGFKSRDKDPYERSFQFQKEKDQEGMDSYIPVLMGWPCRGQQFPLDLDRFRLGAQSFNLLHKFHARPDSVDNDFYLRLGVLKEVTSEDGLTRIEGELRNVLRSEFTIHISIESDYLAFAGYEDLTLQRETTEIIPVCLATEEYLEKLYPWM